MSLERQSNSNFFGREITWNNEARHFETPNESRSYVRILSTDDITFIRGLNVG